MKMKLQKDAEARRKDNSRIMAVMVFLWWIGNRHGDLAGEYGSINRNWRPP